MKVGRIIAVTAPILLAACSAPQQTKEVNLTVSGLDPEQFVDTINGKPTALYTLTNENGMEVCITNLGARIVSIMAPDKDGNLQDVVLGFDNVKSYANLNGRTPSDFGAAIGRFANRINKGKFTLDGVEYDLVKNDHGNTLHGGPTGWQYQVYDVVEADSSSITLQIVSPDGDNGFPGEVTAKVTYILNDENNLVILYNAVTDKPTVINMTNHSYFNLSGDPNNTVLEDSLLIFADKMTPIDDKLIPTGEFRELKPGDPFFFMPERGKPGMKLIGENINADDEQIKYGNGYDHNWVLMKPRAEMRDLPLCCIMMSPKSGIVLVERTSEPGVQVYSGNFLNGFVTGKKGIKYQQRTGICLETQHYPDSPNKADVKDWTDCVLRPGEEYNSITVFEFHTTDEMLNGPRKHGMRPGGPRPDGPRPGGPRPGGPRPDGPRPEGAPVPPPAK
ncbi:MAG: galactose mutarotase [Bacteroidales bacterium]|nr:galactose mutarotase [Bacteroidales bacterium]